MLKVKIISNSYSLTTVHRISAMAASIFRYLWLT
uniref:Uncharacterized protein n=1 Tax=Siphoviridae sp. ct47y1 TaxID=2827775 RepID=A0A8S5T9J1_9CAUD|nr:MAG TPA: hypothetical protein [Siphoviridae sp. ct47y1]